MKRYGKILAVCCLAAAAVSAAPAYQGPGRPSPVRGKGFHPGLLCGEMTETGERKTFGRLPILFSAVLPGSGQFLTGSWLKGALFLGLEAGLLYVHFTSMRTGQDREDAFRQYADTHWSQTRWEALYTEHDPSTHSLPETKTQQYYEMIGKYDQFMKGWDDWETDGPSLTPNRDRYETMRDESNVAFKRASYCIMGVMVNHLLSAFDSAFTIRAKNTVRAGIQTAMLRTPDDWVPGLAFNAAW